VPQGRGERHEFRSGRGLLPPCSPAAGGAGSLKNAHFGNDIVSVARLLARDGSSNMMRVRAPCRNATPRKLWNQCQRVLI
jgi:hypothetical protein